MTQDTSAQSQPTLRPQEVAKAIEFVENARSKTGSRTFLSFFAPDGFGKSTLLERIEREYRDKLPTRIVHVRDFVRAGQPFALATLLRSLSAVFGVEGLDEFGQGVSGGEAGERQRLEECISPLISKICESNTRILLLLDDYDALPLEEGVWFECHVLADLARTQKVILILTSQFELRFTESFNLRLNLESYELTGIRPEAIARAFPQQVAAAHNLYLFTGGIPLLVEGLMGLLRDSHLRSDVALDYYQHVVQGTLLQDLQESLRETVLRLALLRRFDVALIGRLLPTLLPWYYPTALSPADALNLIDSLGSWVQWRSQGGYMLNAALKTAIETCVKTQEPDLYRSVHEAALAAYAEFLERGGYRDYVLMEILYHQFALKQTGDQESLRSELSTKMLEYLRKGKVDTMREPERRALRNALHEDADLRYYMTEEVFAALQPRIPSHDRRFSSQSGSAQSAHWS